VFRAFQHALGTAPAVIYTDSDAAMAAAIFLVWPTRTTHLLCVYHIWKNFYTHIKPLCLPGGAGFQKAAGLFWRLAKDSDESSILTFDAEWDTLVAFVEAECEGRQGVKTAENALAWLPLLYLKRKQFAARWVSTHRTLCMYSTQRAEAMHSAITQWARKSATLESLVTALEEHAASNESRGLTKAIRKTLLAALAVSSPLEIYMNFADWLGWDARRRERTPRIKASTRQEQTSKRVTSIKQLRDLIL
jgi:hypothetical protein